MKTQFRTRIQEVINDLSEEDLLQVWNMIADVYYDAYLLKAIQTAQRLPGDSFTREEALQFLANL